MKKQTIQKILRQVDQLQAEELASSFEEDAYLRVGLDDPVEGRADIQGWFADFFSELSGIHHAIEHFWEIPGGFVVEAHATFRVRGHREPVRIPGALIFRGRNDRLASVRLYYDLHELRDVIDHPDRVFEGVDATFPASDPPAWSA